MTDLKERVLGFIEGAPEEARRAMLSDLRRLEAEEPLSVDSLIGVLSDDTRPPQLRSASAWIIGVAGDATAAASLVEQLRDEAPSELVWEVTKALCNLGHGGDILRRLVREAANPVLRQAAAYGLGRIRDEESVGILCEVVASPNETPAVRGQAAESLAYLSDARALTTLLQAVQDPGPEVRFWSVFALGHLRERRAIPALEKMAATDHAIVEGWGSVSEEAREALRQLQAEGRDDY
jgi:HEAT repeat protein